MYTLYTQFFFFSKKGSQGKEQNLNLGRCWSRARQRVPFQQYTGKPRESDACVRVCDVSQLDKLISCSPNLPRVYIRL